MFGGPYNQWEIKPGAQKSFVINSLHFLFCFALFLILDQTTLKYTMFTTVQKRHQMYLTKQNCIMSVSWET